MKLTATTPTHHDYLNRNIDNNAIKEASEPISSLQSRNFF